MTLFVNDDRIASGLTLSTLVPVTRDSQPYRDRYQLTLPLVFSTVHKSIRQIRTLISAYITRALVKHDNLEHVVMEVNKIAYNCEPAPTLRQVIGNSKAVATSVLHRHAEPIQSPCPCTQGPFSNYVDVTFGHVLTTDMSTLKDVHHDLDDSTVGLNYRLLRSKDIRCTKSALLQVHTQVVNIALSIVY